MLIKKLTFLNTNVEAVPDLRLHSLDPLNHCVKEFKKLKSHFYLGKKTNICETNKQDRLVQHGSK